MAKNVIVASPDPDGQKCAKHDTPLKYSEQEKAWYCPQCLQDAYNSWRAQSESVRRYRDSKKGKVAQERYEQSKKGQDARNRYLKSPKYKERRKEYNQRLQESLRIARELKEAPRVRKAPKELPVDASPLLLDVLEYMELIHRLPTAYDVREWASDLYHKRITTAEAQKIIVQAEALASG